MKQAVVGVDVGGTNTVIGVFDEASKLLVKHHPYAKTGFSQNQQQSSRFFRRFGRRY